MQQDPEENEGVRPTPADEVTHPEQPPMDDDASGLPEDEADRAGDFA